MIIVKVFLEAIAINIVLGVLFLFQEGDTFTFTAGWANQIVFYPLRK